MSKKKEISGRPVELIQEELEAARRNVQIVELRLDAAETRVDKLEKELRENCTHPPKKVKRQSSYFGGTYYDRASTDYWNECTICGTKSDRETKTHSYYG